MMQKTRKQPLTIIQSITRQTMAQAGLREVLISTLPQVVREEPQLIHTNLRVGRKDETKLST
jgi:hypothetical protein